MYKSRAEHQKSVGFYHGIVIKGIECGSKSQTAIELCNMRPYAVTCQSLMGSGNVSNTNAQAR